MAITTPFVTNSIYKTLGNRIIPHALPSKPQTNESARAAVMRKRQKKAWTLTDHRVHSSLVSSKKQETRHRDFQ